MAIDYKEATTTYEAASTLNLVNLSRAAKKLARYIRWIALNYYRKKFEGDNTVAQTEDIIKFLYSIAKDLPIETVTGTESQDSDEDWPTPDAQQQLKDRENSKRKHEEPLTSGEESKKGEKRKKSERKKNIRVPNTGLWVKEVEAEGNTLRKEDLDKVYQICRHRNEDCGPQLKIKGKIHPGWPKVWCPLCFSVT